MKKMFFPLALSLLIAFGMTGCYSYNVTSNSGVSNAPPDTSSYQNPYPDWMPSYAVPPSVEPSAAYTNPRPIREQTPGYVAPPVANTTPPPVQAAQPRVREQSPPAPVVPPQKAPTPRVRR